MIAPANQQQNPYKGVPPRPWIRLQLIGGDGTVEELDSLADTGNPFAIIVGNERMQRMQLAETAALDTNFGVLLGGWLRVVIPELGLDQQVIGYGSDRVETAARASHPDFSGLVGLPLLRMVEYGGNQDAFWVRIPTAGT